MVWLARFKYFRLILVIQYVMHRFQYIGSISLYSRALLGLELFFTASDYSVLSLVSEYSDDKAVLSLVCFVVLALNFHYYFKITILGGGWYISIRPLYIYIFFWSSD